MHILPTILALSLFSWLLVDAGTRIKRQSRCSKDKHRCTNGQCIDSTSLCDGSPDCKDGSDETFSSCSKLNLRCSPNFRCAYGACVDKTAKCNGEKDCADNSDELLPECKTSSVTTVNKTCSGYEFQCNSGQCIDEFSLCDGAEDCNDGSDETITQCINIKCQKSVFRCSYGACIDRGLACNGVKDCADGSDEDEETCAGVKPTKKPPPVTAKPTRPPPTRPTVRPPPTGSCKLPALPVNGLYKVDCEPGDRREMCRGVVGIPADPGTLLSYSCQADYFLSPSDRTFSVCSNTKWIPPPPTCNKYCKGLASSSVEIICRDKGEVTSCESPQPPGAKVQQRKCKPLYRPGDPPSLFPDLVCLESGIWDSPLARCTPDCGATHLKNISKPLISFGTSVVGGEYPWHAGLYIQKEGKFQQACGGTIITPHTILTAAHCIYDENSQKAMEASILKVAVGKYSRSWDIIDTYEQKRDVREVIPHTAYKGSSQSYAADIAILDLVSSIDLNNFVLPACVHWIEDDNRPSIGTMTTVVGWGLTEHKVSSEVLLTTTLPYIDSETCFKEASKGFQKYITYDKFCAGYKNGTGVQSGDSGGGLTIPDPRNFRHYIFGIVSLKPADLDTYAAFTDVSIHKDWMSKVLQALSRLHPQ